MPPMRGSSASRLKNSRTSARWISPTTSRPGSMRRALANREGTSVSASTPSRTQNERSFKAGKSTLLNSLFEVVSVDDRFVAIERGPDLPALKERSFCVRLGVDADTDVPSLFAKARRMDPGRLVVGEIHRAEVREFFSLLAEDPRIGGMATLRAGSVSRAIDAIVAAFGGDDAYARELIANVKPAFVHMHSDETGRPRLAAIWSIAGLVRMHVHEGGLHVRNELAGVGVVAAEGGDDRVDSPTHAAGAKGRHAADAGVF